jgi:hypothetical protein
MGSRLTGVLVAVAICVGLAGCAPGSSTTPPLRPGMNVKATQFGNTVQTIAGPVLLVATGDSTAVPTETLATPAVALIRSSATDLVTLGHVTYAQVSPRLFCNTLESMFGAVPSADLRDLPIWGAVDLPGCVAGQIPALHSTVGRDTAYSKWLRIGGSLGPTYEAQGATDPGGSPPSG